MRSLLTFALPIILLLLTDPVVGNFDWSPDWKNSKLDGWRVMVEPSGKHTGWYQLDCRLAKDAVRHNSRWGGDKNPETAPIAFLEDCERYCRCNMFGKLLLNPMAGAPCNDDAYLVKCASASGGACICSWMSAKWADKLGTAVNTDWRDQDAKYPGQQGPAPIITNDGGQQKPPLDAPQEHDTSHDNDHDLRKH